MMNAGIPIPTATNLDENSEYGLELCHFVVDVESSSEWRMAGEWRMAKGHLFSCPSTKSESKITPFMRVHEISAIECDIGDDDVAK